MKEKDHMIRLKDSVYHKLWEHYVFLRKKYGDNYTISEVIETALENSEIIEKKFYVGTQNYGDK